MMGGMDDISSIDLGALVDGDHTDPDFATIQG